jgi:5-methylthioadenosine/S-adenosylhomocysteine deaminase
MCRRCSTTTPDAPGTFTCDDASAAGDTSRRKFLKAGAGIALAGVAGPMLLSADARAQGGSGSPDPELARVQGARRILLKGGVVLTVDRQVGDFAQADVLIEDGKIREVRPSIAVLGDDVAVIDAASRVIIPGFVDTHSHSYQGLLRNILISGLLNPDYNRDIQNVLTPAYQATDAYAGMLVTALGMIDMGTTAMVDISQVSHTPEHSDACIRALQEAGIRAVFAYHRGAGPLAQYPQDIKRLQRQYFSAKDQLLTLALSANLNANVYVLARGVGVPVVQHLVGEDLSPKLMELARAGLLRPGDEFIHCLGINDAAWRLIKDSGGQVSICAPIDMAMGHGLPAIQEALDHGLRPSLSSDHGVALAQDFFSVMRSTYTLQPARAATRA